VPYEWLVDEWLVVTLMLTTYSVAIPYIIVG
jgi:hypothetical protein